MRWIVGARCGASSGSARGFFPQLRETVPDDAAQYALASGCHAQQNDTLVFAGAFARHQSFLFEAVGKFDDRVVLKTKLIGEFLDGWRLDRVKARNGEKKFVLLRLQTFSASGIFAAA
jgi:hypothetical protein